MVDEDKIEKIRKRREYDRKYKLKNREKIIKQGIEYRKKAWATRIVSHSRLADKRKNRTSNEPYITKECVLKLRDQQNNKCFHCNILMQTDKRKNPDGLTIERLDNSLPHIKRNCVLACHHCNVSRVSSR